MKVIKIALVASSVMFALSGCMSASSQLNTNQSVSPVISELSAEQQLDVLVAQYYDESLAFNPLSATYNGRHEFDDQFLPEISQLNRDKKAAFYKKYQQRLTLIDESQLTGQALLNFEVLSRDLALKLEGMQYKNYLLPINQMSGAHNTFAGFGSGQSAQPFNTVADYQKFIKRADGFFKWLASVEQSMAQGVKNDVVLPMPLAKKLLPQFKAHVVTNVEDSLFYSPIKAMPDSFSADEKQLLRSQYTTLILDKLVPAYQRMSDFLLNDYIPYARDSVGYGDLGNGKAWYEYQRK